MKKALLVQIRKNKKIATQEYNSFLKISKETGVKLDKINICYKKIEVNKLIKKYDFIIVGGSEFSVIDVFPQKAKIRKLIVKAMQASRPFLGICFGFQLLVESMGGIISKNHKTREFGTKQIKITSTGDENSIFYGMPSTFTVQQAHYWGTSQKPHNSVIIAKGENNILEGIKVLGAPAYGVQFHPELTKQDMIERMEIYNSQASSPYHFSSQDMKNIKQSKASEKIITNFLVNL